MHDLLDVQHPLWKQVDASNEADGMRSVGTLLSGIPVGSFLLFDPEYLGYTWYDSLTDQGYY